MPCFSKIAGEAVGVIGEVFEPHGAILEKGDRFPVALHRHHDVEAGCAHFPDRLLKGGVDRLDDGAREAEIAHQFDERLEAPQVFRRVVAGELGQQDRRRLALDEAVDDWRGTSGCRATSSIIVRSTSSTALGPSSTIRRVAAIAL